jgi:peptidoglycan/LPS O-acetylase OafA/YrhL
VLLQRNFDLARKVLGGRFVPAVLLYGVLGLIAARELHWRFNNDLNPVVFTALAVVTFAAAFTAPSVADRVLRRNDLSYGLYLYHAPVINLLLYTQAVTGLLGVFATLTASLALAAGSWWLIERPALALRRHPAYSHSAGTGAPRAGHA